MARRKRGIDEHYIRKTPTETVSNSTALQNDDNFVFPIGTNQTWVVDIYLLMRSGATPDFKFDFVVPTGGSYVGTTIESAGITHFLDAGHAITSSAGEWIQPQLHVAVATGATAGNVQFRWAQNTAEVSNTEVGEDAVLVARRVK